MDGSLLLATARAAIAGALGVPHAEPPDAPTPDAVGACFVTLTSQGRLRGCIGTLRAWRPLLADVRANAVAAALRDPRFPPLTAEEYPDIRIEVSVLTPPEPLVVRDEADLLAQLVPHRDGVILEAGGRRGTFLPQVWDHLSDPATFLRHLKRKAGLREDGWDPDSQVSRYRVVAVREPVS